ncbi:MAG TPA: carboxypeptidase-like regulatory domain-containing protein, partial [Chitinophagaceae bacterium]
MKSCRLFLVLIALLASSSVWSQFTLKGKVVDSTTNDPLYGASVFCQNTTSGTTTNRDGEFSLTLKSGGYDLIVSFTGYQTKEMRITNSDNTSLQIQMVKEEKSMEEVVIRSSNEVTDGWDKYGKFFLENFIGTTPNAAQCELQNPGVLHFYYYK